MEDINDILIGNPVILDAENYGLSAYEEAITKKLFTGTYEEWIIFLKQPAIDAAELVNNKIIEFSEAEILRDTAELNRVEAESVRLDSEITRTSSENIRIQQEIARQATIVGLDSTFATKLDKSNVTIYNVTNEIPLPAGNYYTLTTAIAAVPTALRKVGFEVTFESTAGVWETYQFKGVIANWSVLGSWSNDLASKVDKTSIKQVLGTSTTDVMSQKGITDVINTLDNGLFSVVLFEYGGIALPTGGLVNNTIRIRSLPISIQSEIGNVELDFYVPNNLFLANCVAYNGNVYVKRIEPTFSSSVSPLRFEFDGTFDNIRISFKHSDDSEISQSELDSCVAYKVGNQGDKIKKSYDLTLNEINTPKIYFNWGDIDGSGSIFVNNQRITSNQIPCFFGYNKYLCNVHQDLIYLKAYAYNNETPVKSLNIYYLNNYIYFDCDGTFNNVKVCFALPNDSTIPVNTAASSYILLKSFNSSIFEQTNYLTYLSEKLNNLTSTGKILFEYGGIGVTGGLVNNTIRVRSLPFQVSEGKNYFNYFFSDSLNIVGCYGYLNGSFVKTLTVEQNISEKYVVVTNDGTVDSVRLTFKYSDESEISINTLHSCYLIKNYTQEKIEKIDEKINPTITAFEYGGIGVTGGLVNNTIRIRTLPISCISGNNVYYISNISSQLNIPNICFGYLNGSFVKQVSIQFIDNFVIIFCDGTFDSVRFSFKHSDDSEISQSELDECFISSGSIKNLSDEIKNLHYDLIKSRTYTYGLKYCALGDSITWGYTPHGLPNEGNKLESYSKLTAEKLGCIYGDYGMSGNCLAGNTNPMCVRYADMPNDADIITFMGGTNDIRNGIPLGTMSDRTSSTYYGGLHILMEGLYRKYILNNTKNAKVIAITPIMMLATPASVPNGLGTKYPNQEDWANAVIEVAKYYGIPYIDFYHISLINPVIASDFQNTAYGNTGYFNPLIPDGIHLSEHGQDLVSDILTGFIKGLF